MTPSRQLAGCVSALQRSRVRALTDAVERLGGVNMGQGNNLLPTPSRLIEAACMAVHDRNDYATQEGLPELRNEIALAVLRDYGAVVDPENDVRVTSGATGGFFSACRTLLGPGDEAIVFEPCYPYHLVALAMTGCSVRSIRRSAPDFRVDPAATTAAISARTRLIVLCNPDNPSGRVCTAEEIDGLIDVCRRYGLTLLADEVYNRLVYRGEHLPAFARPGARDIAVTVTSFSKTLAITGWRVGSLIGPPDLVERITLVHDGLFVCAPRPLQQAIASFLRDSPEEPRRVLTDFRWRRDLLISALDEAGFEPYAPDGAYYVLCRYDRVFGDVPSADATLRLLQERRVAAVPGSTFYVDGHDPKLIRFCFALPEPELRRGIHLLRG